MNDDNQGATVRDDIDELAKQKLKELHEKRVPPKVKRIVQRTGGFRTPRHSLTNAHVAAQKGAMVKRCFEERWLTEKCDGPNVCANYNVCNQWGAAKAVKP